MQEKGRNSTACTVVMLLVYQGDSFRSLRFPFIGNNLFYFSWYSTLHHFILLSLQETNKEYVLAEQQEIEEKYSLPSAFETYRNLIESNKSPMREV